jgi:hypothetical protein
MRVSCFLFLLLAESFSALAPAASTGPATLLPASFAPPFAVTAVGKTIDLPADPTQWVAYQNGFPWFGDFDRDGKPDLLVGQGGAFRHRKSLGHQRPLRIYRNVGSAEQPRFGPGNRRSAIRL